MRSNDSSGPGYAPEWQEFTTELGDSLLMRGKTVAELHEDSSENIQKLLVKYDFPSPDKSVTTEDIMLKDGVRVRTNTPPGTDITTTTTDIGNGKEEVTVFMHGGGWIMGSVEHEDTAVRKLCKAVGHKTHFASTVSSVSLMGGSAGANLAFGVALRLLDSGRDDTLEGVRALVPCAVHPDEVPESRRGQFTAYEENAEATANTSASMRCFLESYGPPPGDIYFSVLLHPRIGELRKVYIVECGTDMLRDDARLMRDALVEKGGKVRYDAYPVFPHYFWSYPAKALEEVSRVFYGNIKYVSGFRVDT
ncbi:Alpha/Beta hydrolase protein [Aspergillus falconensis]